MSLTPCQYICPLCQDICEMYEQWHSGAPNDKHKCSGCGHEWKKR